MDLADVEVRRLEELRGSAGGSPLVSQIELEKARIGRKDALSEAEGRAGPRGRPPRRPEGAGHPGRVAHPAGPIDGRLGLIQVTVGQTISRAPPWPR